MKSKLMSKGKTTEKKQNKSYNIKSKLTSKYKNNQEIFINFTL